MKQYTSDKIYNVALAGHSEAGKTSLAEAMLFLTKATDRLGKIADGNTAMDFDPEEIKRKISVATAMAPVEWNDSKINVLDTPGRFGFVAGVVEAMFAADTAIVVLSGKNGVKVGTEKAVKAAKERNLPTLFVINGMCDEGVDFYGIIDELRDQFGSSVCPVIIPEVQGVSAKSYLNIIENKAYTYNGGKKAECAVPEILQVEDYKANLTEAVAESSEELMEKYFDAGELSGEDIKSGLKAAVMNGSVCPVICCDAVKLDAVDMLLDFITEFTPTPADIGSYMAKTEDGEDIELKIDDEEKNAAIIFKTVADPFVGKLSYIKVISGQISPAKEVFNMRLGEKMRITKVVTSRGKKQIDVDYIGSGDIGAIPKLSGAKTGDTLCSPHRKVIIDGATYPGTAFTMAIYPKKKGDEDKVAQGMAKLMDEDKTISFKSDPETKEMVVSGIGETHIDVIVSKLKAKYNVEVNLQVPKVAYREAIRKKVQVQGRHKKQSGGAGQFGDVWIEFEPCDAEGLEFGERVVGGSVPKNFFPAVEKGLLEAIKKGPLAGYPVVGLKATLYDGSYHPVDSNEMAFKMAAKIAYKNGMAVANPALLEPIGSLKASVPDNKTGDVMGEVNKRRGRILGMNPGEKGMQTVEAEVPMAEMHDFATYMRQTTHGRGYFTFDFVRYEDAPANVAQKVIASAKVEDDD
ncbi:MAG: elongation factor G [Clostridia bacterium]|nr:elongation factor G [Clostridia bacterium]